MRPLPGTWPATQVYVCPDWELNHQTFGRHVALNPLSYTSQGSFLAVLELLKNILPMLFKMFPSEFKVFLQTQKIARIRKLKVAVSIQP